ncbi:MAG: hypothetical protein MUF25_17170 [Pirellulaceae bacterium]|nr:hypothetical protein [Pirellulaceae bacterium]
MKYSDLVATIDTASQELLGRAAAVVNQALVLRNWLVGPCIVEYQQAGKDRAKYGTKLLPQLSARDPGNLRRAAHRHPHRPTVPNPPRSTPADPPVAHPPR